MPQSRRAVGLYVNPDKPAVRRVLPRVLQFLRSRGVPAVGVEEQAGILPPGMRGLSDRQLSREARFLLVLGGDGTFLAAARHVCRTRLPLLGLRLGSTGFLTPLEAGSFRRPLGEILSGHFEIERRSMVEMRVLSSTGRAVARGTGLNDIAIKQGNSVKMVRLSLYLGREQLGEFNADGLVVSTPTGATAYSLSAGGPVVVPEARVLLATLLCPHTISSRPVVFSPEQVLTVQFNGSEGGMRVLVDGQVEFPIRHGQRLAITGSSLVTRIVRPPDFSYPELLRAKLGWKS